ncbi:hypothetical protein GE061_007686 [Apolygus lucorum]|uniref:Reverse transcriptase domain-containing protein n=1 Tax=Apolygus lucorum TaxID=248454 RepID=A0A8S9WMG5_APOLU|nr:hypothetical protein GE061_007686 [Apolygus lucorum]
MKIMASKELELVAQGVPQRQMVGRLAEFMPGRSKDMVKGARSRAPYRLIRETLAMVDEMDNPQQVDQDFVDLACREWRNAELEEQLRKGLAAIRKETRYCESSIHLQEAVLAALCGSDPIDGMKLWLKKIMGECDQGPVLRESGPQTSERRMPIARSGPTTPSPWQKMQSLWRKDRGAAVDEVIGRGRGGRMHTKAQLSEFWNDKWSEESHVWAGDSFRHPNDKSFTNVWKPVTAQEIRAAKLGRSTSGPDGISVECWKAVGIEHKRRVSCAAFADDVALVATSRAGIQALLKAFEGAAAEIGLKINAKKSLYLPLFPRSGKLVIPREGLQLVSSGGTLPTASFNTEWKYLGLDFCVRGVKAWSTDEAGQTLRKIHRAPLTVLQKLELLRTHFLPGLIHPAVLGKPKKYNLRKLDVAVRRYVRKWFWLPADSANAYIYGPVGDGGLGLIQLETLATVLRRDRIARAEQALFGTVQDWEPETAAVRRVRRAEVMHGTTDGMDLKRSREVRASTSWLREAHLTSPSWKGRRMVRVHSGSLPSRLRMTRGRRQVNPITCRAGCPERESAAHVLQSCRSMTLPRIDRHNRVCELIRKSAEIRGWTTYSEPHFNLEGRGWRPDLVISLSTGSAAILDVEIVSGSGRRTLEEMHEAKKQKYSRPSILGAVAALTARPVGRILVIPIIITWRGIWFRDSAAELRKLGLPEYLLGWASERVLLGGGFVWSRFISNYAS